MTAEELDEYFTKDKSDWYVLKKGRKIWDKDKVSEFWQRIREKVNKGDYYFREYVFPEFEGLYYGPKRMDDLLGSDENFWKANSRRREFKKYASFNGAKFLGQAEFSGAIFSEGADFIKAKFTEPASFKNVILRREVYFGWTEFLKHCNFQAKFEGYVDFYETTFAKDFHLSGARFIGKADFKKLKFTKNVNINFKEVKFDASAEVLFQDLLDKPNLNFNNVDFIKNVTFRRVNLANATFTESDLTELQFKECEWGGTSRIVLKDEDKKDYKGLEGLYRQIKKKL